MDNKFIIGHAKGWDLHRTIRTNGTGFYTLVDGTTGFTDFPEFYERSGKVSFYQPEAIPPRIQTWAKLRIQLYESSIK